MAVQLNHTIVWCHDKKTSAAFLTDILGLPPAVPFGPMLVVKLANDVSVDFYDQDGEIAAQHYAFLVGEPDFDAAFARIRARSLPYWADPARRHPGEINHHYGGRGVYFEDPDCHLLELITRPYGNEFPS
jgi:catechol 2,3-dioxygenase-like lactoylglutathione lyase family enzyme